MTAEPNRALWHFLARQASSCPLRARAWARCAAGGAYQLSCSSAASPVEDSVHKPARFHKTKRKPFAFRLLANTDIDQIPDGHRPVRLPKQSSSLHYRGGRLPLRLLFLASLPRTSAASSSHGICPSRPPSTNSGCQGHRLGCVSPCTSLSSCLQLLICGLAAPAEEELLEHTGLLLAAVVQHSDNPRNSCIPCNLCILGSLPVHCVGRQTNTCQAAQLKEQTQQVHRASTSHKIAPTTRR